MINSHKDYNVNKGIVMLVINTHIISIINYKIVTTGLKLKKKKT